MGFAEQTFFFFTPYSRSTLSLKTLYVKLTIPHVLHSLGTVPSVQPLANRK